MSYLDLTITEMHQALVAKKVTPLELAKEALARAKANPDNAFEGFMDDMALSIAASLKEPEAENPFWGIPFVIKDNFATKDFPTTGSSNILKDYVPCFDATAVAKLLKAHAVPIAKSTLDELAMGGSGITGHKGPTFNPFDPKHERMIGGSSCGSAVSVAANIVPFALGSDTGDSVRKPAGYAGLVGMKPTWGRISRYGLFPFAPSLDHVGYFTRSVEDSALALAVLAGRDLEDSTSSTRPVEDYTRLLKTDLKGVRVAVIKEIMDTISNPSVLKAFDQSVNALREAGAVVDYVHFDKRLLGTIYPTYITISCSEVTSNNANLDGIKFGPRFEGNTYQEVMFNARTAGFSELIKRRFVIGSFALMRENQDVLFLRAQKCRRKIVDTLNDILKSYDAVYLPSAPTVAPKFKDSHDQLSDEYLIADNHLAFGNFAGLPSLTIPIGFEKGMPLGANVMGRAFEEAKVFQIAQAIENKTGYRNLSAKEVRV